jgi:hypothetical protein
MLSVFLLIGCCDAKTPAVTGAFVVNALFFDMILSPSSGSEFIFRTIVDNRMAAI